MSDKYKRELTINIDTNLYDRVKELNINVDNFVNSKLHDEVTEIEERLKRWEFSKKFREYENQMFIIKLIKRISRQSKFKYASEENIIAEAEQERMTKDEVKKALNQLLKDKIIYKPIKSNYRVVKVKRK